MNRRLGQAFLLVLTLSFLCGCMYRPEPDKTAGSQPGDFVPVVQQAVDSYLERENRLPVKATDEAAPLYEKYPLDLLLLKESGDLAKLPQDAFENGGNLQYVLYYGDSKPQVKLLDLRAFQAARTAQDEVDAYKNRHGGQLPSGELLSPGFYLLDFHKLGAKEPSVKSPYSGEKRYLILDEQGTVGIDYAADIGQRMTDSPELAPKDGVTDLRGLLTDADDRFYLPVRSFPYYWLDDLVTLKEK